MTSDTPDDPCHVWRTQPTEPFALSPEKLRAEAERFGRTISRRNLREYLAGVFVMVVFGWQLVQAQGIARLGPALTIAGTLFILHRLRTRGSTAPLPPGALADSCLAFHRRELERQRNLLRTVWRWYLGPLVPGLAFMLAERALFGDPARRPVLAGFGLFCALLFLAIGKLNQVAARTIEDDLRALEAEGKGPSPGVPTT